MHDAALRVTLSRTVELPPVALRFDEWPGYGGAVVCFACEAAESLAEVLAPRWRVVNLHAREDVTYQQDAADLQALLRTIGLERPLLIGQGMFAIAPLLVAAWWPELLGALLLVSPDLNSFTRGVRECPPDRDALLALVRCPVRVLDAFSLTEAEQLLSGAAG